MTLVKLRWIRSEEQDEGQDKEQQKQGQDEQGAEEQEQLNQEGGRVALSTIHRAKGLEWRVVFLVGCNAGIIPSPSFGFGAGKSWSQGGRGKCRQTGLGERQ